MPLLDLQGPWGLVSASGTAGAALAQDGNSTLLANEQR